MFSLAAERAGHEWADGALRKNGSIVAVASEEEIFAAVGMQYIPPELREGIDEIPRAMVGELPRLVETGDFVGMLHCHSTWSDGAASIADMARRTRELGYKYLAICDHSRVAAYARGLTPERVREQHREIDALNEKSGDFRILKGTEVDILGDGTLDFSDDVLSTFDVVVASVHSQFNLEREAMTRRVTRAISNPRVTILGHPTGRLLLAREPYAIDMQAVVRAAAAGGAVVEINAHPYRLDMTWRVARFARSLGVKIAIDPDAHTLEELEYVRYGVNVARKAGLTKDDVVNCLPMEKLLALARARKG
jgi:DNA polymerase (family 10)